MSKYQFQLLPQVPIQLKAVEEPTAKAAVQTTSAATQSIQQQQLPARTAATANSKEFVNKTPKMRKGAKGQPKMRKRSQRSE